MRRIVRYCASCDLRGVRTELRDDEPDVTIVIDRYGAHTDLCSQCQATLLGPVLEVMATGIGLAELALSDWAKLGGQLPTNRAVRSIRKLGGDAAPVSAMPGSPATAAPRDGQEFVCPVCGQVFDKPSSLDRHQRYWGDKPHEPRVGAKATTGPATAAAPFNHDQADIGEY